MVPDGEGRKALRIESKTSAPTWSGGGLSLAIRVLAFPVTHRGYNGGLFVVEMDHVPTACGAWPAFWMFGATLQNSLFNILMTGEASGFLGCPGPPDS